MRTTLLGLAVLFFSTAASTAMNYKTAMYAMFEESISKWATDAVLVEAIKQQNTQSAAYGQAEINAMDTEWRANIKTTVTPIIQQVLTNPAAEFLRQQVIASNGRITEAFIMDARGLNVAASEGTSDYWQGDEAKFQKTYLVGPNAVHFSDPEHDESTGTIQSQVSMTIIDAATGEAVGALTVGLDLTALM